MKQQINLYQAAPDLDVWQTYRPYPQLAIGLLVAMLLLTIYMAFSQQRLSTQLANTQARFDNNSQRIESLKSGLQTREVDAALQAQTERLEAEVIARRELLAGLAAERVAHNEGFSSYLLGLARQPVQGLWLTQISVTEGGSNVELKGLAGKPDHVPQFLKQLSQEPAFKGAEFGVFALQEDPQQAGRLSFSLSAKPKEEGE